MPKYQTKKLKTIKYPDAPSGKINIGKWVPPFDKVKKGYGFIGIIAEDSKTGQLQCHKCGKWYEQLPTHLVKHEMSGLQYRKKYGLLMGTALKSKRIRLIHSRVCKASQEAGKMIVGNRKGFGFAKGNIYAGNRKGKKKAQESQNKYGVCDLQITTKIINLSNKLGKTPTLIDIKKEYGSSIIAIMYQRYGSYIKYCREELKLKPCISTRNPLFKNKKEWRQHLIKIGIKISKKLKKGEILKIKNLTLKESRYIYKYFKGMEDFRKALTKNIIKKT